MKKEWIFPAQVNSTDVRRLAEEFQLPDALAAILVERGYDSLQKAGLFLKPRLSMLRPPEEIRHIDLAVDRILEALKKQEKIILYGDYDVDGITSLAFLCRSLRVLGAQVNYFIPQRAAHGYGLSKAGLASCFEQFQPDLIIAVDCGTNSLQEAEWIARQGADLIVVDHHEIKDKAHLPPILVNPKMAFIENTTLVEDAKSSRALLAKTMNRDHDIEALHASHLLSPPSHDSDAASKHDYHYLCSVGLVFKLIHALLKRFDKPPLDLRHYLDLVALGTVADIVPLVEENRIFVFHGLKALEHSQWAGIRELMKVAQVNHPVTTYDIGYKLGPRLNAAGRLASALEALELLLTDDPSKAARLAHQLDLKNRERQAIESAVREEAEELVAANFSTTPSKSIVLGQLHWHPGVIGIVASRISKRWYRPTLIIGFDENGFGRGSGRSIDGFSLVSGLEKCAHLLESFGGHAMAAGFSLQKENLDMLCKTFEETANALLTQDQLTPTLRFQAQVKMEDLSSAWLLAQERLGPFGVGNVQPLFIARSLYPLCEPRVLKNKHLRLEFLGHKNMPLTAIFFDGALEKLPKTPWDIAFRLERNIYQGRINLQLQIVAIRAAEPSPVSSSQSV